MNNQEKQSKILNLLESFSNKRIEKITEDDFSFRKLTKRESYFFMECVWIDLGKEEASKKELEIGIQNVYTLMILDCLKRNGLVKLNKKGFFDRTDMGEEVKKLLEKKKC